MLRQILEFGKYLEITGFRGVKIENTKEFATRLSKRLPKDVEFQLFNADLVASWQHLYFATLNALVAFKTGCTLSRTLAVETILYASAQRQIKNALTLMGVKPDTRNAAVLIIGNYEDDLEDAVQLIAENINAKQDETVIDFSNSKVKGIQFAFHIEESELSVGSQRKDVDRTQVLVDLVIERGALLSTRL